MNGCKQLLCENMGPIPKGTDAKLVRIDLRSNAFNIEAKHESSVLVQTRMQLF